ncbi:hypothetical protein JD844_031428 [Phrynosoma platyrhinos]|uniref:Thymocyte nuclear protein 1 n=1 Tax=Phrynosoma platyrhinos TaxID=52577 RepID=A0ABQ7T1A7_PHRPL|nr:hypothetical protein JD844_031428 [Phrynosoma platyrhinos]
MSSRGKKRGSVALKAIKEPDFKVARPETQKKSKDPKSSRSETKHPASGNVGRPSKEQEGSKKTYSHWIMKSEPESRFEKGVDVKFGIEDLKAQPNQTACWDGVRNYQIVKEAYPDHTQFDRKDPHYDASSTKEKPKWFMVDVQFVRMTKRFIPLAELKVHHQAHKISGGPLKEMALFTRQRLSVQPLTDEEFEFVLNLEEGKL